ncbi:hypothetical protein GGR02_000606 [Anoxybacillus voinovskiensis]|uniref:Uncharacterized protein n=1 Tax=Anoxybacteroides voinovskiense TaxID=230470 RepID=A0A840DUR8_9BACL|nr:hypothetical protein [Anoxybacillus voinovskiensis]MBB4072846.1 hypothetical protein [Anoxybacillus voinovskiensis]GGJ65704.1 hypothetical protein GCM10008982_13680 [Anoxybacillus voinovskiensis]
MNLETLFVREKKEFNKLIGIASDTFYIENRLPKQVFREQFNYFLFEEFDWAMDKDFWSIIQQLSKETKDDYVLAAVLDPNPVEYFYKEFNYYNWMKLPVNLSPDEYLDVLELGPEESPADAVLYNSYTVIWLPPSMKWAIWGERSYGVCILGFQDVNNSADLLPILKNWRSIDETVLSWVGLNFVNQQLPQEIANTLFLNYSNGVK